MKLPVLVGREGQPLGQAPRLAARPGTGPSPTRPTTPSSRPSKVVQRLAEYQPATEIHDIWRRFLEGMDYPEELVGPLLDPDTLPRGLRPAAARHGPHVPRLHPHHLRPDDRPRRHQDQRDPRPRRPAGRHPHAARARAARGARPCSTRRSATWPTRSSWSRRTTTRPPPRPTDTPLWDSIDRVTQRFYEGSSLVPLMTVGATDARFFRRLGTTSYGFGLFSDEPVVRGLRADVPRRRRARRRRVAAPVDGDVGGAEPGPARPLMGDPRRVLRLRRRRAVEPVRGLQPLRGGPRPARATSSARSTPRPRRQRVGPLRAQRRHLRRVLRPVRGGVPGTGPRGRRPRASCRCWRARSARRWSRPCAAASERLVTACLTNNWVAFDDAAAAERARPGLDEVLGAVPPRRRVEPGRRAQARPALLRAGLRARRGRARRRWCSSTTSASTSSRPAPWA